MRDRGATAQGVTVAGRVQLWIGRALGVLLFGVIIYVRVKLADAHPHVGWDGGLYLDVAQNLLRGDGLTIHTSLYHHGFQEFPHPTSLYPLWPLVLSVALRFLELQHAVTTFPMVLSLGAIALAWCWGKRMLGAGALPLGLHGGHLAMAMFGLHMDFARFCTTANTESLAYLLLFAALLRGERLFLRMTVRDGLELGLWCAALFLTRSQMLPSMLAVVAALPVLLLLGCGRRALWFTGAAVAAFAVAFAPMQWWMSTFLEDPSFASYLDIGRARVPSALSHVELVNQHPDLLSRLRAIAHGVEVAAGKEKGYWVFFEWFTLVVPAALVVGVAWLAWYRGAGLRALRERFRDARLHGMVWAMTTALGGFAVLHVAQREHDQWWFSNRHAMPAGLLFCCCGVVIVRAFRWLRWPAAFALVFATASLAERAVDEVKAVLPTRPFSEYNRRLVRWLERTRDREHGTLVVGISSQESRSMGWRVPGVGMHSISNRTRFDDLVVMTRDLGARYLVFRGAVPTRIARHQKFDETFVQTGTIKAARARTFLIYELRRGHNAAAAP